MTVRDAKAIRKIGLRSIEAKKKLKQFADEHGYSEASVVRVILAKTANDILRILDDKQGAWHKGEPTDEGWYLVKFSCIYEGKYFGNIEYHTRQIIRDEYGNLEIRGNASDDVWKAIAWQKIDTDKEKF